MAPRKRECVVTCESTATVRTREGNQMPTSPVYMALTAIYKYTLFTVDHSK